MSTMHTYEERQTHTRGVPFVLSCSMLAWFSMAWFSMASLAVAQVPPPDRDGDKIPDAQDNCADVRNDEQSDRDGDGIGDVCDLTVLTVPERVVHVPAGRVSRAALLLAEVVNYTRTEHAFRLESSEQQLGFQQAEGVVAANRIKALYGSVDARELRPGMSLRAQARLRVNIDISITINVVIVVDEPEPASTCTYRVYRDAIEVSDGEGGADPALELDDVSIEVSHGTTSSSESFSGTIRSGATNTSDEEIYNATVDSGELVTLPWEVTAVETDSWDSDDEGSGSGILEFTCVGSGQLDDEETIILGNGSIVVTVKVLWDEN